MSAIKSPKADVTVLYAAIDYVRNEDYIPKRASLFEEIIKSDKVTSVVLTNIIKISEPGDSATVKTVIGSSKADEEVLYMALRWAIDRGSKQTLEEVVNSNKITPELLIKGIEYCGTSRQIICVIKSPKTNMTVLYAAMKWALREEPFAKETYYLNEVLEGVASSDKITPELLVYVINHTLVPSPVINAIKNPKADETVFDAAMKWECPNESLHWKIEVLNEIANTDKATPELLVRVILNSPTPSSIINAINNPKVDITVLEKALEWECTRQIPQCQTEIFDEIVKSDVVTPELLVNVICNSLTSSPIIHAINSSKADETVLEAAMKREYQKENLQCQTEVFDEIVNSDAVTPELLVNVIRNSLTSSSIIHAINSPKADMRALDAALDQANEHFMEMSENSLIRSAIEEKRNSINGDLEIESEVSVTERIRRNVEDGMSTMIWGLSGIGKTARVREIDPTFTMIKLKNDMLPEEVTGGKEPNGEPGKMYPPNWYVKLCEKCETEPDRMHILFIDEITNVKNTVKSLVWDIIEDRRVNGNEDWPLPSNCAIIGAGNRPEESTAVITDYNGGVLPEPLHDRFDFHIEIPLDMREWQQWALETDPKTGFLNIHPSVLSFCITRVNEVMFSNLDPTDVTQPRLSPRRWAKLSKAIFMAERRGGNNCRVSDERIAECIGKELAPAFIVYYHKPPFSMEKVVSGYYEPNDFPNIDDKLFAISSIIASKVENELAVIDFIELCLGEEYVAIYNAMKKQRDDALLGTSNVRNTVPRGTIRK
ncbi:MAG: hypothetical protein HFG15_03890 [Bacilli bacterium]|nr:hypothetical protein [Bacilli bacterium]